MKFTEEKLFKTIERDKDHKKALNKMGRNVIVVWECEIDKNLEETLSILKNF